MTDQRHPLVWPEGWRRTLPQDRIDAPFKVSPEKAQRDCIAELQRLGATDIVLSTNIPIRRDGLPYANANRRILDDEGAAIFFKRKGKPGAFACDKFRRVHDNIRAIGKTIEALRGIERWGASDMLDRAFTGFEALPAPEQPWQVLGISQGASREEIKRAHRDLAMSSEYRGNDTLMSRINAARDSMLAALDHRSGS